MSEQLDLTNAVYWVEITCYNEAAHGFYRSTIGSLNDRECFVKNEAVGIEDADEEFANDTETFRKLYLSDMFFDWAAHSAFFTLRGDIFSWPNGVDALEACIAHFIKSGELEHDYQGLSTISANDHEALAAHAVEYGWAAGLAWHFKRNPEISTEELNEISELLFAGVSSAGSSLDSTGQRYLAIKAHKLTSDGDDIYEEFDTHSEWALAQGKFFPIKPNELFQLEVAKNVDLLQLIPADAFSGTEQFDASLLRDGSIRFVWADETVFDRIDDDDDDDDDKFVRFAAVVRGDETWQIVGFDLDDRIVYALQRNWDSDEDEAPELTDRFASRRVLIDYSFHTDGPGPVSWDVHSALLDMGDWALGVHEVDWGVVGRPVSLTPSLPEAIFDWLKFNNVLELFVLKHAECKWVDEKLRQELEEARWSFEQIAGLETSLSESEADSVLESIRESQSSAAELLLMFESAEDARAADFVSRMTRAADEENASILMDNRL